MDVDRKIQANIDIILSQRNDNGADYWETADGHIYVGNPFSTISSLNMLHELGLNANHEAVRGCTLRMVKPAES